MKRLLTIILAVAILISVFGMTAFAEEYSDISSHWARDSVERFSELGVINGFDGKFYPDNYITRGEMAVVLCRIMSYEEKSENTFKDLGSGFYTEAMLKASNAGIILGYDGYIRPEEYVTRQEAAVMLCRAFEIEVDENYVSDFYDAEKIDAWAAPYVNTLKKNKYLDGENGLVCPNRSITRAETVRLIDNIIAEIINTTEKFSHAVNGICIITADNAEISDCVLNGNVIVTDGAENKRLSFNNVSINGTLIVKCDESGRIFIDDKSVISDIRSEFKEIIQKSVPVEVTTTAVPSEVPAADSFEHENTYGEASTGGLNQVAGSETTPPPSTEPTTEPPTAETSEPEPVLPVITTTLENDSVYKGKKKLFDVLARDAEGNKIDCVVTLNGEEVPCTWDDENKTSYTLEFNEGMLGENTVTISATDKNNLTTEVICNIIYQAAEYGEVIGTSIWCVEIFTIGGGYIIEPVSVEVREGINAAVMLEELLLENGYETEITGSVDEGYYMSKIKGIDIQPSIPDVLLKKLGDNGFDVDITDFTEGEIGEFDFTQGAGWKYCLNGNFLNVGLSDCYVKDGDVMRIQFTLARGADIGETGEASVQSYFTITNRDELTRKIAEIGIEHFEEYIDIITKPDIEQDEIDNIVFSVGQE